jgi:small subunit ribosomal protein S4
MQAKQMITHGHFLLNRRKHNIPSYYVKPDDKIELRQKLHSSPLIATCPLVAGNHIIPSWIQANKKSYTIEMVDLPKSEEVSVPVDMLKVIEFYARA